MSNTWNGHFKWFDEDGSQRGCRVLGLPAEPAEMILLAKNIDYDRAVLDYKVKAAYRAMKVGR